MNLVNKLVITAICLFISGCAKKDYSHLLYVKEEEDAPTASYKGHGDDLRVATAFGTSVDSNGNFVSSTGILLMPSGRPSYRGNFEEQAVKAKEIISALEEIANKGKRFKAGLDEKLQNGKIKKTKHKEVMREYAKFRVYADSVRMWKREFNSMLKSEDGYGIEAFIVRRESDRRPMLEHLNNARNIAAGVE